MYSSSRLCQQWRLCIGYTEAAVDVTLTGIVAVLIEAHTEIGIETEVIGIAEIGIAADHVTDDKFGCSIFNFCYSIESVISGTTSVHVDTFETYAYVQFSLICYGTNHASELVYQLHCWRNHSPADIV